MAKSLAAVVDATGISAPLYAENLANLQDQMRGIYGADIYIEPDSQDGQLISIVVLAVQDTNDMAIAVYNDFSPGTAQGVGLSSVVKVNGIRRQIPSNSSVIVDIGGEDGTIIINGIVGDNLNLNTQWTLPQTVVIPPTGTISVTATCTTPGAITAGIGTITDIKTPRPGWQTVNNTVIASVGAPVELDPTLRRRQAKSASLPAQTPREAIEASVANVLGVTRAHVYQNDTNTTDANGVPSKNIAVVVEGGDATAIATAIALKKPPGTPTYGTITEIIFDSKGVPDTIHFFVLSVVQLTVLVYIDVLDGYVASTGISAVNSIVEFVDELDIDESSYRNRLMSPAQLKGDQAVIATGVQQTQLDLLAETYDVTAIYQNRSDCHVLTTVAAGGTSLTVTGDGAEPFAIGDAIRVVLTGSNAGFFPVTVTSVAGFVIGFTPAVPLGNTIQAGSLVFTQRNITARFNEAFSTSAAQVNWLLN